MSKVFEMVKKIKVENNFKEYSEKTKELLEANEEVIKWSKKASTLADELADFELNINCEIN